MIKKKYISIARCSLQQTISYRLSYFTSIFSQIIFIVFLYYLWQAIFKDRAYIGKYSWEDMKKYIIISYVIGTNFYTEWRISKKILDGTIAMDLTKPLEFEKVNLAETIGTLIFELIVSLSVSLLIIIIMFKISLSLSLLEWVLFILSVINALFIKFCVIFLAALTAFWTNSVTGVTWARAAITNLFSGALIPLGMFPDWLQKISSLLPFQGIINTPVHIFLGGAETEEVIKMLVIQILWGSCLWMISKGVLKVGLKRLTINGG